MATFLLFTSDARLSAANHTALDYGTVDPLSQFFAEPEDAGGHVAIEVSPEVLKDIRPDHFDQLVGHAVRCPTENGSRPTIELDPLDQITRRLKRRAIDMAEMKLFAVAQEVAGIEMGTARLGFTPASVARLYKARKKALRDARVDLERWEGSCQPEVPRILVDWAGQVVPL